MELRIVTLILVWVFMSVLLTAPVEVTALVAGNTAAPFLKIGPGARAVGMGSAFTGMADDVTSLFWNPSGLANLTRSELTVMHASWFQGINYEYIAVGMPFGPLGHFGSSLIALNPGDIEETTIDPAGGSPTNADGSVNESYFKDLNSKFTAWDILLTIGYARRLDDRLKVGGSLKTIIEMIKDKSAMAFAVDLGVQVKTDVEGLQIGGVVQNAGSQVKLEKDAYPLPLSMRIGAGWKLPEFNVNLVSDFVIPVENKAQLNTGLEYFTRYKFAELVLRTGYRHKFAGEDIGVVTGITAGLGASVMGVNMDYAFEPYGELGNTHRISLTFRF